MATLKINEILIASSANSIITGNAGFGIRTISEQMPKDLAQDVYGGVEYVYELPVTRQVKMQQLVDDPSCVTRYPVTLRYCSYDRQGKKYYVAAKTTYVGVDYGYFCDIKSSQRTGTNYITHMLVSESPIPASLWAQADSLHAFYPADNTARPDNPELISLLTGKASPLPQRELVVADQPAALSDGALQLLPLALRLALGLQINKAVGKSEQMQCAFVKVSAEQTADFLEAWGALPRVLTDEAFFVTNYLKEGMPRGYSVAIVNEYFTNNVSEDTYVVLNLMNGAREIKNVDGNAFFDKATAMIAQGHWQEAMKMAAYVSHSRLTATTDYQALVQLYELENRDSIDISEITADWLSTFKRCERTDEQTQLLKKKISQAVNESVDNAGDDIQQWLLDLLDKLRSDYNDWIELSDSAKEKLTSMWMEVSDNTIGRLKQEFVKWTYKKIAPDTDPYYALAGVSDSETWRFVLNLVFGDRLKEQFNNVATNLNGDNKNHAEETTMLTVYPLADNKDAYRELFMEAEADLLGKFGHTIADLCEKDYDYLLDLINNHPDDPQLLHTLGRLVDKQLAGEIGRGPEQAITALETLKQRTSEATLRALGVEASVKKTLDMVQRGIRSLTSQQLDRMLQLGLFAQSKIEELQGDIRYIARVKDTVARRATDSSKPRVGITTERFVRVSNGVTDKAEYREYVADWLAAYVDDRSSARLREGVEELKAEGYGTADADKKLIFLEEVVAANRQLAGSRQLDLTQPTSYARKTMDELNCVWQLLALQQKDAEPLMKKTRCLDLLPYLKAKRPRSIGVILGDMAEKMVGMFGKNKK